MKMIKYKALTLLIILIAILALGACNAGDEFAEIGEVYQVGDWEIQVDQIEIVQYVEIDDYYFSVESIDDYYFSIESYELIKVTLTGTLTGDEEQVFLPLLPTIGGFEARIITDGYSIMQLRLAVAPDKARVDVVQTTMQPGETIEGVVVFPISSAILNDEDSSVILRIREGDDSLTYNLRE